MPCSRPGRGSAGFCGYLCDLRSGWSRCCPRLFADFYWGLFNRSHQASSHRVHRALFGAIAVVVTDQVQEAVGQQETHLGQKRPLSAAGLTRGGVERDDYVSEQTRPRCGRGVARFCQWKSQHIRSSVLGSVTQIEGMNVAIVGEEHTQLGVRKLELGEHGISHEAHRFRQQSG
jgi:hypothetical protein